MLQTRLFLQSILPGNLKLHPIPPLSSLPSPSPPRAQHNGVRCSHAHLSFCTFSRSPLFTCLPLRSVFSLSLSLSLLSCKKECANKKNNKKEIRQIPFQGWGEVEKGGGGRRRKRIRQNLPSFHPIPSPLFSPVHHYQRRRKSGGSKEKKGKEDNSRLPSPSLRLERRRVHCSFFSVHVLSERNSPAVKKQNKTKKKQVPTGRTSPSKRNEKSSANQTRSLSSDLCVSFRSICC